MMNREGWIRKGSSRGRGEFSLRSAAGLIVALLLSVWLTGCAPKLYSIDMRYIPTKTIQPPQNDGRKYGLTVAAFIDQRKQEDTLVIGRVVRSDGETVPVLPKYVTPQEAVAAALRELLRQSGYAVSPAKPEWDLAEGTIRPEWGAIVVGGAIEALEVTCVESYAMKKYTARVRVSLAFADVSKKRIFYRVNAEGSSSLEHIVFSEEKLEAQINTALSDAMEKAVEGPEMARRIREALGS
ncbi:MAG: YajG family lipoprotein [Deltaproteobacteria bacterium]|nr:YajG family lipoprotein [Deltaproteobacteria bacterium]